MMLVCTGSSERDEGQTEPCALQVTRWLGNGSALQNWMKPSKKCPDGSRTQADEL